MKKVYLNTIIGQAEGLTQQQLVDYLLALDLSVDGLEYRYEMFSEAEDARQREFLQFLETGKLKNWDTLLSIPDNLFTSEGLSPKLEFYLQEATQLGAQRIKLNIGDLKGISQTSPQELQALLTTYPIAINIENDQSLANGLFNVVAEAIKQIEEIGLPIGYTFDAGNYGVLKEDAAAAFAALKKATSIFHVKNIDDQGQATLLNEGIMDWQAYLELDVPYVLEYPIALSDLINELKIFKEAFY